MLRGKKISLELFFPRRNKSQNCCAEIPSGARGQLCSRANEIREEPGSRTGVRALPLRWPDHPLEYCSVSRIIGPRTAENAACAVLNQSRGSLMACACVLERWADNVTTQKDGHPSFAEGLRVMSSLGTHHLTKTGKESSADKLKVRKGLRL